MPRPLTWRIASVVELRRETPSACTLVLDVPEWPGHRAGQHIDVRLTAEDGYQAQRSFSIASAPETPYVELTIERIEGGEVSPYLADELVVGDELEVRGPIGLPFTWSVDDGGPLLLAAGGSGLVPLMSMLRHRAAHTSTIPARALISVRTEQDALYFDELQAIGPRDGLDVRWTYTRAAAPTHGFHGRVSAEMLAQLVPGELLTSTTAPPRSFVCGPTGFVETVASLLVEAGQDPMRIHTERFGPTG